jgi:hypothetical protein
MYKHILIATDGSKCSPRFGYSDCGRLSAQRLCQPKTGFHGCLGALRAIRRNQDVLVHGYPPIRGAGAGPTEAAEAAGNSRARRA